MPATRRKPGFWSEKRVAKVGLLIAVLTLLFTALGVMWELGGSSSKAGAVIHSGPSAVNNGANSGNVCSGDAKCTVVQPGEQGPRAQIVALTGTWSEQGFVDAIMTPADTNIVDLYLRSGITAAALNSNTSAILYGFQDNLSNDPIALLKTFQANGYKLNDVLTDGRILQSLAPGNLPLPFQTNLTPKNYSGGYQGAVFTGPLMLWIIEKAVWLGPTDEDKLVLKYLIAHGADCSVTLSFLDFNRGTLADTAPFQELYPVIKACAR